ncbi:MAG: NUDIX hydrolase [Proteobacteria bacterium]|nr:NUDIX hydrolase [Pseudomonadota bacterium]
MKTKQIFETYNREKNRIITKFSYCPRCGARCISTSSVIHSKVRCPRCGFILYQNPYPGIVVLIVDNDMILLGERDNKVFMGGKWSLPGGFIEFDEDFLSAAHREIMEETGLSIKIISIISVVSNFFSPDLHTLVIVLLANKMNGTLRPGDDMVKLEWFPISGPFPSMAFEADKHIINRYYTTKIAGTSVDPRFASL